MMLTIAEVLAHPSSFRWSREVPLSRPATLATIMATYLLATFLLRGLLRGPRGSGAAPRAKQLNATALLAAAHNLVLCGWSLAMFAGVGREVLRMHRRGDDLHFLFCAAVGTRAEGPLYYWSYVYYLSKFYELLDTAINICKGKPLTFLHVYHHCLVMLMCYLWLEEAQSMQFIGLAFNTGIHVLMYLYYFLCSVGIYPRWKVLVTQGQIVQFVTSFLASAPLVYNHATGRAKCQGFSAWLFNAAFNASLLWLFVRFHQRSYSRPEKRAKRT